ncbi:septum formation inhibitor Maf [Robertkochia sediminum]|uniref:septum formation inhibitor Maf n=1 Tax=Robertkochia sediminum TaxID=2785326 RepID=UPI0019343A01|nr:septum formation inhibitor Maf [Robertkochia sediminum]MBL7473204.1 septum formation inhibitor Maf [Robertkochia sediminum]
MKSARLYLLAFVFLLVFIFSFMWLSNKGVFSPTESPYELAINFSDYWNSGEAEITSYELEQARYGEIRKGNAVLIYVTEPFNTEQQVKAESASSRKDQVLKLNMTRNFLTGIYPYSIMSSTFFPLEEKQHAIKVSASVQEWCGQIYSQLNNRGVYEILTHSYFEGEADRYRELEPVKLENEIWTIIRLDPNKLPQGSFNMLPALEYMELMHLEPVAYKAQAVLRKRKGQYTYALTYPSLNRELAITFDTEFPYVIHSWKDTYLSGGENPVMLESSAKKIKRIKTAYWERNKKNDTYLYHSLGL